MMRFNLQLVSIVLLIIVVISIIYIVQKGRISVKYSMIWLFSCGILLLFSTTPGLLEWLTRTAGFELASNMIFAFIILLLLFVTISLTVVVSSQTEKIRLLIQEVSLLKEGVYEREKSK